MSRPTGLLKRQLFWVTIGLLAYLGAGLLLLTALMPALAEDGIRMDAMGPEHAGALVVSLVLFVLGGYAARRLHGGLPHEHAGRDGVPDAYQPSVAQRVAADGSTHESGDDDPDVLTCSNCGAVNERFYTYCGECSEKL